MGADQETARPGLPRPGQARPGLPRWAEATLALLGLVAALPVLVVAGVAVRLTSRGPAIFRQERVGRRGEPFVLLKLRTMTEDRSGDTNEGTTDRPRAQVTAQGDARITAVGRILRRTKLDEVPQLWNVLRGDLALVGPRPEVPRYVDRDDPELGPLWRRVLAVRPGVTDPVTLRLRDEEALLAQLTRRMAEPEHVEPGGAETSEVETAYRRILQPWKLRRYVEYLERRTPWTDLRCLVATAAALFRRGSPVDVDEILAAEFRGEAHREP